MVGSGPHRASSHKPEQARSQQQGNFLNPECDRNEENGRFLKGSVNTTKLAEAIPMWAVTYLRDMIMNRPCSER